MWNESRLSGGGRDHYFPILQYYPRAGGEGVIEVAGELLEKRM